MSVYRKRTLARPVARRPEMANRSGCGVVDMPAFFPVAEGVVEPVPLMCGKSKSVVSRLIL